MWSPTGDLTVFGLPPQIRSTTPSMTTAAPTLVIKVAWENLPAGSHMQTLEILLPSGGPYQVTQTGLDGGGATLNSTTTTRILPVAGTSIPQRQIVGNWMIRVSLDGQLVASQMVALNP